MLCVSIPVTVYAQAEEVDVRERAGILFLTSDPMGAEVYLNGSPLVDKTPVLLRDLDPGTYEVELVKEGYKPISAKLEVNIGSPVMRDVTLESLYFKPRFIDEKALVFNGDVLDNPEYGLRLDTGAYLFRRNAAGSLIIDPVYPRQNLISALNFSISLFAVLSGVLTANDIIGSNTDSFSLSPSTTLSWGVTLSLTAADLFLLGHRRTYLEKIQPEPLQENASTLEAATYYNRGERLLSLGNMDEALNYYTEVLDRYPESPFIPRALYKIAKIHQITGETSLAATELQLILDSYPVPDLYDKACQNLAVLYFREGHFEKSLTYLDAMVFVDPLFSREEVALYGSDILKVWSESTQAVEEE